MHNVISFSGGRTSAYMVHLIEQKRKAGEIDNVHYVFMDTGAEHPKTYEFIRNCVEHFGIKLTCLRCVVDHEGYGRGFGTTYKEVTLDECKPDLEPWYDYTKKYGVPNVASPACTREMKTKPHDKWCNDNFGYGNYTVWLGIRADEGRRLKQKKGMRYLAEISRMEKHEILGWWEQMPFDLGIPEWLGNCVFCIKKGSNKIALSQRDEPELAEQWEKMVTREGTHQTVQRQELGIRPDTMYRNWQTFEQIRKEFEPYSTEDILSRMRSSSGGCTESCEVFGCQGDLFAEQE